MQFGLSLVQFSFFKKLVGILLPNDFFLLGMPVKSENKSDDETCQSADTSRSIWKSANFQKELLNFIFSGHDRDRQNCPILRNARHLCVHLPFYQSQSEIEAIMLR